MRHLHPLATAAGGRLDDHRIADVLADPLCLLQRGHTAIRTGNAGHAQVLHRVLGGNLVAHYADVLGRRADEGQPVVLDDLNKARILG